MVFRPSDLSPSLPPAPKCILGLALGLWCLLPHHIPCALWQEDLHHLSPAELKWAILLRSFRLMGLGTVLVLLFSDPMVDALAELGQRTGVPAFYVSFVLAPLASNASELLASYKYSLKKTKKTITISLSSLQVFLCPLAEARGRTADT